MTSTLPLGAIYEGNYSASNSFHIFGWKNRMIVINIQVDVQEHRHLIILL